MYCDGGSYSGNNATPTTVFDQWNTNATRPIYYRGSRNLDFALQTLQKDWGMAAATDILISGDSAGVPRFRACLPPLQLACAVYAWACPSGRGFSSEHAFTIGRFRADGDGL